MTSLHTLEKKEERGTTVVRASSPGGTRSATSPMPSQDERAIHLRLKGTHGFRLLKWTTTRTRWKVSTGRTFGARGQNPALAEPRRLLAGSHGPARATAIGALKCSGIAVGLVSARQAPAAPGCRRKASVTNSHGEAMTILGLAGATPGRNGRVAVARKVGDGVFQAAVQGYGHIVI